MTERGIPLTRENYLSLSYLGNPPKFIHPEEESMTPHDLLKKAQAELRREDARQKKLQDDEQAARIAFREYIDTRSRSSLLAYAQCRGYRFDHIDGKTTLAELNSPDFLRHYYPETFAENERRKDAKAWAADVKPLYVAKCKYCRTCFMTDEEMQQHLATTLPCPKCMSVCSKGGEVHRCEVYGGRIEEDRLEEVKEVEQEE